MKKYDSINKSLITKAYINWKWCMLDNQYKGINIISADLRCNLLYKEYKRLLKIDKKSHLNSL